MKVNHKINWAAIGGIAGVIAAVVTLAIFIWTIAPDNWKVLATLIYGGLAVFVFVGYLLIPILYIKIQRYGRFVKSIAIAVLIPLSHYLILTPSWQSALVAIIDMVCILSIISVSKEWRKIQPLRFEDYKRDVPFQWGGIMIDEVGRGPGMKTPDGAPDAEFKLLLQEKNKIVDNICLNRLTPNGQPTRQIWRSEMDRFNWVLGIIVQGQRIEPDRNGKLNIQLTGPKEFDLFASDSWSPSNWFASGQKYKVNIKYMDGSKDEFSLMIP